MNLPNSKYHIFIGISSFLKSNTIFRSLDNCYRTFSYGLGPDPTEKYHVLEVTDGNVIQSLKNEDILEWFNNLNLFGWWNWEGYKLRFYFNNSNYLEMVKNWIMHNYQEVQIEEKI